MSRSLIALAIVLTSSTVSAQQPAAARPEPPRRRPSMVGYVNDGTIGRQLRIRFDSGFGVDAPDRAEFFYAKGGWYRELPGSHSWYDPAAAGMGHASVLNLNFQQLYLLGEYPVRDRVSIFGEVPLRWVQWQHGDSREGGLSDVRLGAKLAIPGATDARQMTLQVQVSAPTGDSFKGLGTNHASFEPALLYAEQLSDRFGLEAQFGGVMPLGGSPGIPTSGPRKYSGGVIYYGVGPSYDLFTSDRLRFAGVVEVVGWHVTGGFQSAEKWDASGTNIVNLKIGGRVLARDRSSVYVGYGFALTGAVWYDDLLRFEYRISF